MSSLARDPDFLRRYMTLEEDVRRLKMANAERNDNLGGGGVEFGEWINGEYINGATCTQFYPRVQAMKLGDELVFLRGRVELPAGASRFLEYVEFPWPDLGHVEPPDTAGMGGTQAQIHHSFSIGAEGFAVAPTGVVTVKFFGGNGNGMGAESTWRVKLAFNVSSGSLAFQTFTLDGLVYSRRLAEQAPTGGLS